MEDVSILSVFSKHVTAYEFVIFPFIGNDLPPGKEMARLVGLALVLKEILFLLKMTGGIGAEVQNVLENSQRQLQSV